MAQTGVSPADSPGPQLVRGVEAVRDLLGPLIDRAQHEVALFAPQLPAELFNTVAFIRAFASFAARHRRNRGRLLLGDAPQALRDNDRLVALARRLSDAILVRQVAENDRGDRDIVLLVDHSAYLQQQDSARVEAVLDTRGGPAIAKLVDRFEAMWDRSEPVAEWYPTGL